MQIDVQLLTAKPHQIRGQLAAMGCPIVGDYAYGGGSCEMRIHHHMWQRMAVQLCHLEFAMPESLSEQERAEILAEGQRIFDEEGYDAWFKWQESVKEGFTVPTELPEVDDEYSEEALFAEEANDRFENNIKAFQKYFPEIAEKGGFDVFLGNPPWERIKLQEKERELEESKSNNNNSVTIAPNTEM